MMEEKCNSAKKYKHDDQEFNPVLVNVFDDERTLDEEEALEPTEDPQTELQNLQREGDMPLEELLALCGYTDTKQENDSDSSDSSKSQDHQAPEKKTPVKSDLKYKKDQEVEEIKISIKEEEEEEEEEEDEMEDEKPERSELCKLYEDILPDTTSGSSRPLRSLRPQSEEEDEDNDYSPEEEELKKTIMVGSNYQAYIPEGLCKYDDALPYENEDKLLWDPSSLTAEQIEKYLVKAQEVLINSAQGVNAIPMGAHTRDDEQALYLLFQCDYNMDEALRRMKMNVSGPTDTMSLWSEEECRNFETGFRTYGKNFHLIQLNKVRTRSVGELVQFYYLWKKTERHDIFANKARLEKKKYTLHPGITDYMDRFLEDQDSAGGNESGTAGSGGFQRDRSSSPNVQCLIYGDHKRQGRSSTSSPSNAGKESNVSTTATDNVKPLETSSKKSESVKSELGDGSTNQLSNVKQTESSSLTHTSESSSSL
ncbi:mesoderm induction early response protein 1-like isoform X1 [Lycorma delicatula]|uniref:mesoderm induction early response protein 1-like isoform X1 n=1 Tax=Lycorma delicatula TaxID=130591 RepID=UPI003F50F99F